MHDDLQKLAPLSRMADAIDLGERYLFLDCVQMLADRGLAELSKIAGDGGSESSRLGKFLTGVSAAVIDWDVILRMGNAWYDRFVAALRRPTRAERATAMNELDEEIRKLAASVKDVKSLALYSVGVNGKDDGGLSYDDRGQTSEPAKDYDDLVVQVPLKLRQHPQRQEKRE